MAADKERFKKLGVSNLLELALITPYAYENNILQDEVVLGVANTFEAKIRTVHKTPKVFKFSFYAKNVDLVIDAVIFNYQYFHIKSFLVGAELFLKGKVEENYGSFELMQPKVISVNQIGHIIPKYLKSAANKTVTSLIKKYISSESLEKENLPKEIVQSLMLIHYPSVSYVNHFNKMGYTGKIFEALKYTEILNYYLRLSRIKNDFESFGILKGDVNGFIASLPFALTGDQQRAISDIRHDVGSEKAAKRIVMGDVGCGKTMVILSAVMMAYPQRCILMAPTTLLAKQLFEEAQKHLPKSVSVVLITNKSKKEDLSAYDFIIGTHALLYRELPKAPLVMVDEQHRFGTKQRELIKQLVSAGDIHPHFIQFSATPIPRTFSMLQSRAIDFSFIKELPFQKDIDTVVMGKEEFPALLEHIQNQIDAGHQSIIVYPLVNESETIEYQSLEEVEAFWKSKFDKVYVTHGKDKEKEEVLAKFSEDGNILLSTTVIEVGISLPKLTTIVISAPERLGLASLHQLRGRVSRNGLKGYCYLFTKTKNSKRLRDFTQTTNGFEIAELDLTYRQSGDLLTGDFQSGKSFKWIDFVEDEALIASVLKAVH